MSQTLTTANPQCDKSVPSCHQCLKSGLVCGGYGRDIIWLHADTETATERKLPWLSVYSKPEPALPESLALSAREQKYLGLFWTSYFPNGRVFSDAACTLSTGGWTRTVNALYGSDATLRKAMLALSAGVLGAKSDDGQLQLKGLQTYCDATADMFRAVQHPRRARADGTLAAVRLLEFYEVGNVMKVCMC